MNFTSLTHQFFNAATLPAEPAIAEFKVRPESSMGKLQQAFSSVGLSFHRGRKSLFIAEPTREQERQLKREGIELHSRQFKCSPRKR
jgi:hypothetical protein